ncbi:MAG: response regulator [Desulfohalobiaceae bacterium]|nr:response regulator [Desulfohalobiaceae bacterium]
MNNNADILRSVLNTPPSRQKILIVDDKRENLAALRRVLADVDADIIEAASGNEALAATLDHRFAVAVLDVMMPGMDGYELAEYLRGDAKIRNLPVIFLTAVYTEEKRIFKGYEVGAVDYIVKPYKPEVLVAKVRVFLELDQARAELAEKITALTASEERYRSLVTTIPDIVYRIDTDGRFTYLNDAVHSLGYSPEELLGTHFSIIMVPADVERASREWVLPAYRGKAAGADGPPKLFDERRTGKRKTAGLEVRLLARDGKKQVPGELYSLGTDAVTVEINSSGVYAGTSGDGGKKVFLGTVGVIRDITERKRVEKELARHRDKLERLVQQRVKEQACLYGISEVLTESHQKLGPALRRTVKRIPSGLRFPARACARIQLDDRTVTSEPFRETEWRLTADIAVRGERRGAVEVFYLEELAAADQDLFLREEAELVTGIGRLAGQALERAEAEALLKEGEEKYRTVVENTQETILVAQDGRIRFVNGRVFELLGYRPEEIMETQFADYIHPEDRQTVVDRYERRLNGQAVPPVFTFRVMSKEGQSRWVEINAVRIQWLEKPATLNFLADITEKRRSEAEREALQQQLQQAQRLESVGRLAGGLAHDFNNKLCVIQGNVELMLQEIKQEDPRRDDLQEIQEAAQSSSDLIRQLLAFARKQTVAPQALHLNNAVEGMLKMLRRLIGEDIDLSWQPAPDLWLVLMDPSQLDQILANLSVNARDAISGVGRISIETRNVNLDETYCTKHADFAPGEYVSLAVNDDGSGMDQGTLDKVFEPFFTTKEQGKGTGLGLSTVYGIVKQNQGVIDVCSEPGQGCTFTIYLPAYRGNQAEETELKATETDYPQARGETVLVVEDEAPVLRLSRQILEKLGYTALVADSPRKALELVRTYEGHIHLLMTDVVMPEMNGKELAGEIQKIHPRIKVLFLSGYTPKAIARHGFLEKGVHFLQKPFTLDRLAGKVRTALDGGQAGA